MPGRSTPAGVNDDDSIEHMLWRASAASAPAWPSLDGPAEADVAIVGAGFTGLSAAIHLADAGKQVVVLDARQPGWGASGRNGGQVNPGFRISPAEILRRYGPERGKRLVDIGNTACDRVFALIERFNIECEARRPGFVQGAVGPRGLKIRDAWVSEWQREGVAVESLSRKQIADLLGTAFYCGGYRDGRGGSVQPLSYARGLARAADSLGARIYGDTTVRKIVPHDGGWRLVTQNGDVTARNVVVATNAYSGSLWPKLARTLVPVRSFITATDALPSSVRARILPGGHAVAETRRIALYYRMDDAGRFIMGGRGNPFSAGGTGSTDHLVKAAIKLYPGLAGLDWPYRWSGLVAVNFSRMPAIARLADGLYTASAYNGRGVAMATAMGIELASLIVEPEKPTAFAPGPLAAIPYHRVRQAGVAFHVTVGAVMDRLDQIRGARARDPE